MPLRKGQTYSRYGKVTHPSAKYRIPTSKSPLKSMGRKVRDIDGWKVK